MAILADKKVVAHGSLEEILKSKHPFVERFFKNDYLKHRMDRFSLIGD
jgi:phospholipid/cholesterol/gamma-HCH transport system ATP-binding protein